MTERAHTHTHIHALVKGVVRNIISYIKTNLEASCFLSYFFFSQFPASLHVFSDYSPPPILPFFQSHSLLDFISLKKKTFIYLSKCAQDRSRSIIIMKYKITQVCFSFLGLLQASRKFPGQKGQQGERKQPQSPSPHTLSIQGFPAYKPSASLYSDKVVWIHFKQAAN